MAALAMTTGTESTKDVYHHPSTLKRWDKCPLTIPSHKASGKAVKAATEVHMQGQPVRERENEVPSSEQRTVTKLRNRQW